MILEILSKQHAEGLLQFELTNKEYFEQFVPPRQKDYFSIDAIEKSIVLMEESRSFDEYYLYVILNTKNEIIGRFNVFNIDRTKKSGEIGYRIGQEFTGKGIATLALDQGCNKVLHDLQLEKVIARTLESNVGSQKVLLKNGFVLIENNKEKTELNGETHTFFVYERLLSK